MLAGLPFGKIYARGIMPWRVIELFSATMNGSTWGLKVPSILALSRYELNMERTLRSSCTFQLGSFQNRFVLNVNLRKKRDYGVHVDYSCEKFTNQHIVIMHECTCANPYYL